MTAGNANGSTGTDKRGGGLFISGNVSLANCLVTGNTCIDLGGGIYMQSATSGSWENCQITNNSAPQGNGSGGGATLLQCSNYQLRNCQFTANQVNFQGGGLYISGSTPIQLVSCVFDQNAATAFGGFGGGLHITGNSNATIVNSFITRNRGNYGGGLITNTGSIATCINTTISSNTSGVAGGAVYSLNDGRINLTNCVLWGNDGQNVVAGFNNYFSYTLTPPVPFNYNDQGGNIIATFDPFESSTGPALKACAPAIDAGSDAANTTTTDLLGNARKVRTIDMGAAEFRGTPYSLSVTAQATPSVVCVGVSTSLQATPSGSPNTPYSYTWVAPAGATLSSTSDNPVLAKPTSAGTPSFRISVTDKLGCLATASVSVTANAVPTQYNVTGGGSYCAGGNGVEVGLSGSQTGVTYQLQRDGNAVGSPVAGTGGALSFGSQTTAGRYTVQATNASTTCQQVMTGSATVTPNPLPTRFSVTGGGSYCAAGSGVVVGLSGSQTGVSYQLRRDGNAVGNTVAGTGSALSFGNQTVAGTYTVQATNTGTTCQQTMSDSASVTVNNLPTPGLTNNGPLSCTMTTVTLTATGAAGVPGNSYTFTDGNGQVLTGAGDTRSVSSPGVYAVRVANEAGCISTTTTSVTSNTVVVTATLSASPSTTLTCSQPTLTLTASGGDTYRFSSNVASQSGNQATMAQAGVYSVTTTSTATGCFGTASITISQDNAAPLVSLVSSGSLRCDVTSATLTASPGGQSYRFSDGVTPIGTTNQATVTTAGIYSVTVSYANGCSSVASTTVTADQTPPTVSITPTSGTLTCTSPTLILTANTSAPTLQWSNGQTTPSIAVNASGTYSVTVVGANGCSSVASTTVVGDQSVPVAGLTNDGPLSCTKTSVLLTASGSGTYQFSQGATPISGGPTATVTTAGVYSVTVVGANGCSSIASTTVVGDQSVPMAGLTNDGPLTCTKTSVLLTASGSGTYQFSSGATPINGGSTASVITAGVYSVTVVGSNGCTSIASTTVVSDKASPLLTITPSSATLTCVSPMASLTAMGTGTVRWSTGSTDQAITVSSAGIYSVTLTAPSGCTTSASVNVTADQTAPSLAISPNSATLTCAIPTTSLTAVGTGTVRWSTGSTDQVITVSSAGVYSVTLTGPSGCTSSASVIVTIDQSVVGLSLTNDGPLSCTKTSVLLTANGGGGSYQFSAGATPINGGPTARVSSAGVYSVTVTSSNGCSSVASTTVVSDQIVPVAGLINDGPLSCTKTSVTLTASGVGTYRFSAGATLINGGNSATVASAGVYSVTVVGANGCSSMASTTVGQTTCDFALTGATSVSCQLVDPVRGEHRVVFTPQYRGLNAQPLAFSIVNELAATTAPGPYTLRLYSDNPVITLVAQQGGVTSTFAYNWLASCGGSVEPPTNTSPTVVNVIPAQTASVGQPFSYVIPGGTFSDAQTPTQLVLSVTGLPAGLRFTAPATISGVATVTGVSTVQVTATDPGSLSAGTSFQLTVSGSVVSPPAGFAISGVTTVSCVVVDAARGQRQVTFIPQYSGLSGQPVSFSVVNELVSTQAPGPYSLRLYSDNPVITLVAQQGGVSNTFSYNWLSACGSSQGRVGVPVESTLQVKVLGNPMDGDELVVEVSGAAGQSLSMGVFDERGYPAAKPVDVAAAQSVERVVLRVGGASGAYLLRVSTPTQNQTVKVLKAQ
ncbi:beta strand repeat-containing protein [Spirosoma pomorum]